MLPVQSLDHRSQSSSNQLALIANLIRNLSQTGVSYCHWKSNHRLSEFLSGTGDLDLLVAADDRGRFQSTLSELGFIRATTSWTRSHTAIEHYYGLDADTGRLVHLHVYYRLITGGILVKDYELPFASQLLSNTQISHGVPIPAIERELLVFAIRKLLEASAWTERYLLRKGWPQTRPEWQWLQNDDDHRHHQGVRTRALQFAEESYHSAFAEILRKGMIALDREDWSAAKRCGQALRRELAGHCIVPPLRSQFRRLVRAFEISISKAFGRPKKKQLSPSGLVIAITGCDGSGKSHSVKELQKRLGGTFSIRRLHLGRPGVTGFLWRLFRRNKTRKPGSNAHDSSGAATSVSVVKVVIRFLLAWERRKAAIRAKRWACHGEIVICDRYPSLRAGMDGPSQCEANGASTWQSFWLRMEKKQYQQIPPADLVIRLVAPPETLRRRLIGRGEITGIGKTFDSRYQMAEKLVIPAHRTVAISAIDSPSEIQRQILQTIWSSLGCEQNSTKTSVNHAAANRFAARIAAI